MPMAAYAKPRKGPNVAAVAAISRLTGKAISPPPTKTATTMRGLHGLSASEANEDSRVSGSSWLAGLLGYSHLLGGYAGGQAEFLRVPFADVGPIKVPEGLNDEQVRFLSDIFPTGYMEAEFCNIQRGDTIAVWGCGPVGQFAIRTEAIAECTEIHMACPRRYSVLSVQQPRLQARDLCSRPATTQRPT
jgi:hypothetical protein